MTLHRRVTRLEETLPQTVDGTPAVLVIPRHGRGGEPLVIGGSKEQYIAALRRLRGEENSSHEQG